MGGGVLESQNPKCQELPKFLFGGGGVLESQNPRCQDLPKFQFWGEGVFWKVKTHSAKICLNFYLGVVLESQDPKYQDLPKFLFRGVFWKVKTQSAKIWKLSGWCSGKSKPKVQRSENFQGGVLESQNQKWQDLPKFQFLERRCSGKSKSKVPRSA